MFIIFIIIFDPEIFIERSSDLFGPHGKKFPDVLFKLKSFVLATHVAKKTETKKFFVDPGLFFWFKFLGGWTV